MWTQLKMNGLQARPNKPNHILDTITLFVAVLDEARKILTLEPANKSTLTNYFDLVDFDYFKVTALRIESKVNYFV